MPRRHTRRTAVRLTLLCLALVATTASAAATPQTSTAAAATSEIAYTVSMPKPYTHLLEVEMRVAQPAAASSNAAALDLVMPVWTPGSYLVREFGRHVQDFEASAGGQQLAWTKVDKNTWRVTPPAGGGAREVRVTYRVYANELTVRTNELNDRHAFWNNAALLMYPAGRIDSPSTVRVVPFGNWKVATGLPPLAGGAVNTFRAENFDVLYDSPFEVGDFREIKFDVRGKPHRIVIEGQGNYDAERLRADVGKVVEAAAAVFGGELPYRDYTFILNLRAGGGGGLEHLNSTALIASPAAFRDARTYRSFLSLVAHEFFHLWNVKRIRPDALGPFDYTKENYTRSLWVAEGITSYYEEIILRRANLVTDKEALEGLASTIRAVERAPGRRELSLQEASFDAWIKYYRPDENAINSQISYYDKGALVGMLLDLEIRQASNGARSLDDVMRALYADFYRKNRNYTPADFQRAAEAAAGRSLEKFFASYVGGRAELDYNAALAPFGLRLETDAAQSQNRAFLSAAEDLRQDGDHVTVVRVVAGSPAYEQGLNAGDQIVALDDYKVTRETLLARVGEMRPGDTVRLTVFRHNQLRALEMKLGAQPGSNYKITALPQTSADQKRLYQGWLG